MNIKKLLTSLVFFQNQTLELTKQYPQNEKLSDLNVLFVELNSLVDNLNQNADKKFTKPEQELFTDLTRKIMVQSRACDADLRNPMFQSISVKFGELHDALQAYPFDAEKSVSANFALQNIPEIHANPDEENKFRGAINIWLPLQYTDENGQTHKGFFNKEHPDEQDPEFAINHEVRPGNMNKRNELTYLVAQELGLEQMISKAIPMKVVDDSGNSMIGTFMENAEGSDYNHLSASDPLLKCTTDEALSNPGFLKQLSDIQAFDWLCGNTDRSPANTIYQVNNDDPEHPFITGIKGIDHDSSFFQTITEKGQGFLAAPGDMKVISQSMAEKVKNLSDDRFREILSSHPNITEGQIRSALIRKSELTKQIKRAEEVVFDSSDFYKSTFKIIPDDKWGMFKMSDFADPRKFRSANPAKGDYGESLNIFDRVNRFASPQHHFEIREGKNVVFSEGVLRNAEQISEPEQVLRNEVQVPFAEQPDVVEPVIGEPDRETETRILAKYHTQLYLNNGYIQRLKTQTAPVFDAAGYSSQFAAVFDEIDQLSSFTEEMYRRDGLGKAREFTPQDLQTMQTAYDSIAGKLGKLEGTLDQNSELDVAIRFNALKTVAHLQEIIAEDCFTMSRAKPGASLGASVEAAGSYVMDISDVELEKPGGKMPSRIPLTVENENQEEIKGLFIPESDFDPVRDWKAAISSLTEKNDSQFAPVTGFLENYRLEMEQAQNRPVTEDEALSHFADQCGNSTKKIYDALKRCVPEFDRPKNTIDHVMNRSSKRSYSKFEKFFEDFEKAARDISAQITMNGSVLGLHKGDNIDKRNAAMSSVAAMLGVRDLVVNSEPMTLMNNGVEMKGTFIPDADGLNVKNPNNRKLKGVEPFQQSNGYKDLTDLQILDYICGNVGRNIGNVVFKFDKNNKFVGAQGIDNDCSFGTEIPTRDKIMNGNVPALSKMKVISKSMADHVKKMDPDVLKTMLRHHGLGADQITAAGERLKNLQTYIAESEQDYLKETFPPDEFLPDKIKIIGDDEFKNLDFWNRPELSPDVGYVNYTKNIDFYLGDNAAAYQKTVQTRVQSFDDASMEAMSGKTHELDRKLKELGKVDRWFCKSSEQFRKMKEGLEALKTLTRDYSRRELNADGLRRIGEQLDLVDAQAKAYITMKESQADRSEYAKSRVGFAKELSRFVKATKENYNTRVKTSLYVRQERNLDAKSLIDSMREKLQNNAMSKELAAEVLKTANKASEASTKGSVEAVRAMELVSVAAKYLNENNLVKESGLQKADYEKAMKTVQKGKSAQKINNHQIENKKYLKEVQKLDKLIR